MIKQTQNVNSEHAEAEALPVIMTSGSTLSAADADDWDDCVWSDSKGCGIGWGGNRCGEINGPAG